MKWPGHTQRMTEKECMLEEEGTRGGENLEVKGWSERSFECSGPEYAGSCEACMG